jgi:hypothetical protein
MGNPEQGYTVNINHVTNRSHLCTVKTSNFRLQDGLAMNLSFTVLTGGCNCTKGRRPRDHLRPALTLSLQRNPYKPLPASV